MNSYLWGIPFVTIGISQIKDCVIDEKNKKVVLKFADGDVKVAIASESDEFNVETGILWAYMKHLFEIGEAGSTYTFIKKCIEMDNNRRNRKREQKESKTDQYDFESFIKNLSCLSKMAEAENSRISFD